MAEHVNVHEAKTHFSRLLARVEAGEEIVVARNGTPVAKVVAYREQARGRRGVDGIGSGRIWIADDAFSPEVDAEIAADFYGDVGEQD